jgi:glutamyl/glutaminyl-tRNA synthetase
MAAAAVCPPADDLGPDKSKLSKRHGATAIKDTRIRDICRSSINFLALLGWSLDDKTEIMTVGR